ncbi:unnamed protein product [Pylaiella littoralis]
MSDSQEGATTAEEESQDTTGASQLDNTLSEMVEEIGDEIATGKKKKKAKAKLPIFTERDPIERLPLPPSSTGSENNNSFTVLSWNVNGVRATVKNGLEVLRRMVETERPDLVCLQETKIQEKDIESLRARDILPGYASEWSCSTTKKGYSGTAVFFTKQAKEWTGDGGGSGATGNGLPSDDEPAKKKPKQEKISSFFSPKSKQKNKNQQSEKEAPTPAPASSESTATSSEAAPPLPGGRSGLEVLSVRFGVGGGTEHNTEGRSITVEYEKFFVVTVYVPNSGDKLVRLKYRTEEWDAVLRGYVETLEAKGKPVVLNGDLNVAHLDLDIYNRGAPHLVKTSGTTKEERDSFGSWLEGGKVADAFRWFHPDARGAYTFWSVRANGRPFNKGLRLDYFICSSSMFEEEEETTGAGSAGPAPGGKGGGKKRNGGGGRGAEKKKKKETAETKKMVVHDCFILEEATVGLSDHCPVGITLRSA